VPALWLSCILGRALNWDCIIGKAPPFLLWLIAKVSLGVKLYCGLWIFSSEKRGTSGTQQLALTSRDQKRRRAGGEAERQRDGEERSLEDPASFDEVPATLLPRSYRSWRRDLIAPSSRPCSRSTCSV